MADPLSQALDLLRRLPPSQIADNLETLITLCPELGEELISSVDQPLKIRTDPHASNREYLICDYNRDGDSFRSPWSSRYDPEIPDGTQPSPKLRELEIKANEAFNTYRQLYYNGGLSSVYLWDLDTIGFAGVVLFKKELDGDRTPCTWDSLHVFEVSEKGGRSATYALTSSILLTLGRVQGSSSLNLSGNLVRQSKSDYPVKDNSSHVANMGRMIEDMEGKLRNQLQEVYFSKTKSIISSLRTEGLARQKLAGELQKELMGMWKR